MVDNLHSNQTEVLKMAYSTDTSKILFSGHLNRASSDIEPCFKRQFNVFKDIGHFLHGYILGTHRKGHPKIQNTFSQRE